MRRRVRPGCRLAGNIEAEGVFPEDTLLSDELDLSVDPAESNFGAETFDKIVFGDGTYNALCEDIRGVRIWDLPEDCI